MNQETKQEIFTKVYNGLKAQGFVQSMVSLNGSSSYCAYRGNDGRKCAAGHYFTDEQLEQFTAKTLMSYENKPASQIASAVGLSFDVAHFLTVLQGIHDRQYTPESMKNDLEALAKEDNLTFEP